MTNHFYALAITLVAGMAVLTSTMRNPSNPPTGKTGAPKESTCAESGCHEGGGFTGMVTISGVPDTILPDQTYAITLTQSSNAVRAGFQITCLDEAEARCGTFSTATGVSVATGIGPRQYARHSQARNLVNGSVSWTFNWKAPATAPSKTIKFYYSSLAADGTGNSSGDNVLLGSKTITFGPTVSNKDVNELPGVTLYPNPASSRIFIQLATVPAAEVKFFNAAGRIVRTEQLNSTVTELSVLDLPAGVYNAVIESNGRSAVRQFVKQ